MDDLAVALIQMDVEWEDWQSNRLTAERLLLSLAAPVDLILLPEMFGSGFTMSPERVAQQMDGAGVQWMSEWATRLNAVLMGSLVITDEGKFYNRLLSVHPDNTVSYYDKRHLFTYSDEHLHYTPGGHRLVETVHGWRVCPFICYDLRFPVWSRNKDDYDLLVYVANWPAPRINAWEVLLQARAIENLCYTVGLNRIGTDANGLSYPGKSSVYDAAGHPVHRGAGEQSAAIVQLNAQKMLDFRASYNFLTDRDIYYLQ